MPDELIISEMSPGVNKCDDPLYSACNGQWFTNDPVNKFHICTDHTCHKYLGQHYRSILKELYGATDISFPYDDSKGKRAKNSLTEPYLTASKKVPSNIRANSTDSKRMASQDHGAAKVFATFRGLRAIL